jgi:hypothetical protein
VKPQGILGGYALLDVRPLLAKIAVMQERSDIENCSEAVRLAEAAIVPFFAGEAAEAKYHQSRPPVRNQQDMKRLVKQWTAIATEVVGALDKKGNDATTVSPHSFDRIGNFHDIAQVGSLVNSLAAAFGVEEMKILTSLYRRTDKVIAEQWPAVRALAAALLRKTTLTGKEVAGIVAGKIKVVSRRSLAFHGGGQLHGSNSRR